MNRYDRNSLTNSPNGVTGLCCCEYYDISGKKNHLLATCCNCEAVDSACEQLITCKGVTDSTISEIIATIYDRIRMPWFDGAGARRIRWDIIVPLICPPSILLVGSRNNTCTWTALIILPLLMTFSYVLWKRSRPRVRSPVFFYWMGTSCFFMYVIFQSFIMGFRKIYLYENLMLLTMALVTIYGAYMTKLDSVLSRRPRGRHEKKFSNVSQPDYIPKQNNLDSGYLKKHSNVFTQDSPALMTPNLSSNSLSSVAYAAQSYQSQPEFYIGHSRQSSIQYGESATPYGSDIAPQSPPRSHRGHSRQPSDNSSCSISIDSPHVQLSREQSEADLSGISSKTNGHLPNGFVPHESNVRSPYHYAMEPRRLAGTPHNEFISDVTAMKGPTVAESDITWIDSRGVRNGQLQVWCDHCQARKIPRTAHCNICHLCVLGHDHHCIWLNCCISASNHRTFLCTLVLAIATLLFGSHLSLTAVCTPEMVFDFFLFPSDCRWSYQDFPTAISYITTLYALMWTALLCWILVEQVILISQNLTYSEMVVARRTGKVRWYIYAVNNVNNKGILSNWVDFLEGKRQLSYGSVHT